MVRANLFKFKDSEGKGHCLTLKEKQFCKAYLDLNGNGVEAIYEAGYKPSNKRVAASMAHENLTKPDIFLYIGTLLNTMGWNDENVRKQHLFVINQMADLQAKNKGLDMFYKLSGEYAPTKIKLTDDNDDLTDEQLEQAFREREKSGELEKKPGHKKKA